MTDIQAVNERYEAIKAALKVQGGLFLSLGALLKDFRDNKLYEALQHPSFLSFLSAPEIGLKESTAYSYISIYEIFVEKYGFSRERVALVPFYKLQLVAPAIKDVDKDIAEVFLSKAESLSPSDLKLELKEETANQGFDTRLAYPSIHRCKDCGKWVVGLTDDEMCWGHKV